MVSHETLLTLAVWILLLPIASFAVLIFFNKRFPRRGDWLATSVIGAALVMSCIVLGVKLTSFHDDVIQRSFTWAYFNTIPGIGPVQIELGMMSDNLSAIMLVVVTTISTLVHLFSMGYMKDDVRYGRYFAYLGLFSFSMLMIVLTNNFFTMYVGWELVGISSYLLIGHWYEKKSASDAAKKAFVVNRVGDLGMLSAVIVLFAAFHTLSFDRIFTAIGSGQIPFGSEWWLSYAGIAIFCAAVGKSAQFPLHVWLPDAMEGPTPVSALIHAATMVAAGVYLIARTYVMLTATALMTIAYIGAATAFIAATIAIAQNDIKKVLAYSTVSQLGYMMMALGVGAFTAGFFHLVTHAMFKAGLFLGSGSVIYAMHNALHHQNDHHTDAQDIRTMGGLKKKMPVTYWTFLIYTLSICGVPPTSGFLSKDEILAGTMAFGHLTGHIVIPIFAFLMVGVTAFYMFRVFILTFLGEPASKERLEHVHESPKVMIIPLMTLAALSLFFFFTSNPLDASKGWLMSAVPRQASVVPSTVASASPEEFAEARHAAHYTAMFLSLAIAAIGIFLAYMTYVWKKINADSIARTFSPVYRFLVAKWKFDELYDATAVNGTLWFSKACAWFDNKIIDGAVNGSAWLTKLSSFGSGWIDSRIVDGLVNLTAYTAGFFGLAFRKLQTGRVQTYIIFVIFGAMVFFFIFR